MTSKLRVGDDITTGGSRFFFSIPFTIIERDDETMESNEMTTTTVSSTLNSTHSSSLSSSHHAAESEDEDNLSSENNNHLRVVPKEFQVLIVDDVLSNRRMLNMVLTKKGLTCVQEGDGFAALKAVQSRPIDFFDFIFMDSRMPKMNGLVTTAKLREMGFGNIIVGFTGNAMDEDVAEFLAAGVDIVLPKPLKMAHLDCLLRYCSEHGTHSTLPSTFGGQNKKEGEREEGSLSSSAQRSLASILGIEK